MSGKRSANYRGGDRSEYLAKYGLSRFSFVYDVDRQEDFGVDFYCTLAAERDRNIYPEESFYIQVKSDAKFPPLERDVIQWMHYHAASPIYYCVVDKGTSTLSIYSTTLIWNALSRCNTAERISIALRQKDHPFDDNPYQVGTNEDDAEFKIYLGGPILVQTLDQLEEDKGLVAYTIMKRHVLRDMNNIINMRLGKLTTAHIWEGRLYAHWYERSELQIRSNESKLIPNLVGLFLNYVMMKNRKKATALMSYLSELGVTTARLSGIAEMDESALMAMIQESESDSVLQQPDQGQPPVQPQTKDGPAGDSGQ